MKTTKAGRIDMILCCEPYGDDEQSPICAQGIRYLIHDITELERKLGICVGALEKIDRAYGELADADAGTKVSRDWIRQVTRKALASIQAAPTNPVDETESSGI